MNDAKPLIIIKDLANLFKILSEPNRLLILDLLMQGIQCNCEIGRNLQMAPNLVSHHINVLRKAGLVDMERDAVDARWVYYSINRDMLDKFHFFIDQFFTPSRIKSRRPDCGPEIVPVNTLFKKD